jgi:basic membrane lipoprotein Med (substrate-binding protein (PBP1-ABC) superfamily)|tara:strand:+ start:313 stop:687 length:375 start_codon:yes stop_codon:yes gene_type:complete
MVTFRNNNNRRNNFRRNDRNFKSNGDRTKFGSNFSNNENFQRKLPGRNNHNAPKLIEKYNNLAREALSSGDRILSENYFQHADHFMRVLNEKEIQKKNIISSKTDKPQENISSLNRPQDEVEKT